MTLSLFFVKSFFETFRFILFRDFIFFREISSLMILFYLHF